MQYFHPDVCIETIIRGDEVIVCAFCYLDKKELTIENDDGSIDRVVLKEDATREYLNYLKELSGKPNIQQVMAGGEDGSKCDSIKR